MNTPTTTAWHHEQDTVDETEFTPWATEGWMAWNGQSPEVEVCVFAAMLTSMMKPRLVIETGVGQGYMTRFLVDRLSKGQHLIAYESNDKWREELWGLEFWKENSFVSTLSGNATPDFGAYADGDLFVFDSEWEIRFKEISEWQLHAKPGAVALIHDTSDQPQTIHQSLRSLIRELGMTGVFLQNPRGCFMAVQP